MKMSLPIWSWTHEVKRLVISDHTGDWCRLPYPNHPKGCPMYNNKKGCPPNASMIEDFFDMDKPLYLVSSAFNLELWAKDMKEKHPTWTERQCRNVLYWQPKNRKELDYRIILTKNELRLRTHTTCPEAMGVNVYATARNSGLMLEPIKDLKICRHVALVGTKQ